MPLLTNVGQKKIRVIFFASLFGILLFVAADRLARSNQLSVNSYDHFGTSDRYGANDPRITRMGPRAEDPFV